MQKTNSGDVGDSKIWPPAPSPMYKYHLALSRELAKRDCALAEPRAQESQQNGFARFMTETQTRY